MAVDDIMKLKGVDHTEPEMTRVSWYWYIDTDIGGLDNIFKIMNPTENVPYMSWNNIHKIHRNIDNNIPRSWNNTDDDLIIIQHKKSYNSAQYTEIQIQYDQDENKYTIVFELDAPKSGEKTIDDIYNDIKQIFPDGIRFTSPTQTNISVIFNLDIDNIRSFVLLDMITNDPLVAKYISVNEFEQITKSYLTLGFHKNGRNAIPATFTFTVTQTKDNKTKIKIRKPQEKETIDNFIEVITRIFAYYELKKEEIIKIYKGYGIVATSKQEKAKEQTTTGIKIKGISRSCPKQRGVSSFVTRDQAIEAIGEDDPNRILELEVVNKKDNITTFFHACTKIDPKKNKVMFPYPGIIAAQPGTQDDTPKPCCYKSPRTKSLTDSDVTYTQTYQLGENKRIPPGKTGDIPSILSHFNRFITLDDKNKKTSDFVRVGISSPTKSTEYSTKSIAYCILDAKNQNIIPEERELFNNIPNSQFALCKQELYDHSVYEIKQLANDPEKIMKYSEFASFLEYTYKVNLVVFSRTGIVKPRSKYGFRRRTTNYPVVILFEETDYSYQLIRHVYTINQVKNSNSLFPMDEEIAKANMKILTNNIGFKMNDEEVKQFHPIIPDGWKIKSQSFDAYGKTRCLNIINGTDELSIYTSPLQPYDAEENISKYIKPYDENKRKIFDNIIREMTGRDDYTIIEDGNVLTVSVDMFEMKIPIKMSTPPITINQIIAVKPVSEIKTFISNKRLARYLIENLLWLYSTIEKEKSIAERIVVNNKHRYTNITKQFNLKSGIYNDKENIVVLDEDIKKRLLYILEITKLRTPEKLDKYKDLKFVPNFYLDVTDFIDVYAAHEDDPVNRMNMSFNVFTGDTIFTEDDMEQSIEEDD
jgi:hypothetical protein